MIGHVALTESNIELTMPTRSPVEIVGWSTLNSLLNSSVGHSAWLISKLLTRYVHADFERKYIDKHNKFYISSLEHER